MKELHRARQVGICAIAFACLLRLWIAGVPEKLYSRFVQPNIDAFFTKLETGRNVRFSSSIEPFVPNFVETPPPLLPEVTEAPLPAFSGEEEIDL